MDLKHLIWGTTAGLWFAAGCLALQLGATAVKDARKPRPTTNLLAPPTQPPPPGSLKWQATWTEDGRGGWEQNDDVQRCRLADGTWLVRDGGTGIAVLGSTAWAGE